MKQPLVSVIIPVFNVEEFLCTSLESVLSQTYKNIEVIVIDDGSGDRSPAILGEYAERDRRVRAIFHEANRGVIPTRNEGFSLANGELIAIMDADDFCYPTRIQCQVEAFEHNPRLCLAGMDIDYLFFRNRIMHMPERRASSEEIRVINIFDVFFVQPSVMLNNRIRSEAGLIYDPTFSYAEDYELFSRISRNHLVSQINVKGIVVRRQGHDSIARRHRAEQLKSHFRICVAQLKHFGIIDNSDILLRIANLDDHLDSENYADLSETIRQLWMYNGFYGSERTAYETGFSVLITTLIEAFQLRGDIPAPAYRSLEWLGWKSTSTREIGWPGAWPA